MLKFINTVSKLLPMLLLGVIIGGIISGNAALCGISAMLIAVDVLVGITTQYFLDNARRKPRDTGKYTLHTHYTVNFYEAKGPKTEYVELPSHDNINSDEEENQEEREEEERLLTNEFYGTYFKLKRMGVPVAVKDLLRDEHTRVLVHTCSMMEHAPTPSMLTRIREVRAYEIDGRPTLRYAFYFHSNSISETVYVYLVNVGEREFRFLTLESSNPYAICEYSGHRHINYGQTELKDAEARIKEILNSKSSSCSYPTF